MESRLGKYELVTRLAAGGMAELFLARASGHHGFEKTVVLKRILPAYAQNGDFIRMFLTEAQIVAGLHHPNIAQVHDFGEEGGAYFFTMEYAHGRDLRQLVRAAVETRTPIPVSTILYIMVGIAAGLHHAHEHRDPAGNPLGIVHRDVSPSNAIVTYEGNVKLVDFGIAKAASLGPGTAAGSLKGKIAYMSPEQCRGELVDRRSDVFSLGTLLWELSVGRRLFDTEGAEISLLHRVEAAEIPPPRSIIPNYPPGLEAIVLKALARDRGDRYATALAFRKAVEDFAYAERIPMSSRHVAELMGKLFSAAQRVRPDSSVAMRLPEPTPTPSTPGPRPAAPGIGVPRTAVTTGSGQRTAAGVHLEGTGPMPPQTDMDTDAAIYVAAVPNRVRVWTLSAALLLLGLAGSAWVIAGASDPVDDASAAEPAAGSSPAAAAASVVAAPAPERPALVAPSEAPGAQEADAEAHAALAPDPREGSSPPVVAPAPAPEPKPAGRRPSRHSHRNASRPDKPKKPSPDPGEAAPPTPGQTGPTAPPGGKSPAKTRSGDVFLPRRGKERAGAGEKKKTGFL